MQAQGHRRAQHESPCIPKKPTGAQVNPRSENVSTQQPKTTQIRPTNAQGHPKGTTWNRMQHHMYHMEPHGTSHGIDRNIIEHHMESHGTLHGITWNHLAHHGITRTITWTQPFPSHGTTWNITWHHI